MTANTFLKTLLGAAALILCAQSASAEDKIARGEYLATIMDCGGCHTTGALIGKPDPKGNLAGSDVGFQIPGLGIFYPSNLTSDQTAGLGKWTEDDIVKAVRLGVTPDGRQLAPAMPYMHYARLTDEDAAALAAYIKSLPANDHKVPAIVGPNEKPVAPYLTVAMP